MTTLNKVLLILGALVVTTLLGIILYLQHEMNVQQATIASSEIAQKQLVDGLVQSSSQFASKADLDDFITKNGVNLKAVQDAVDKLGGTITAANTLQSNSQPQSVKNAPSNSTGPNNPNPVATTTVPCTGSTAVCPNADPFGYQKTQQNLTVNEDFPNLSVPFAQVGFSAWQQKPWSLQVPQRQYNVNTIIATDKNQQINVVSKFSVNVNGKEYDLPIQNASTVQQVPTASFSFWNPRLFLTTGPAINLSETNPVKGSFNIGATLGIMSYGQYLSTPKLSILQLGLVYETGTNRPAAILNPINFNIGSFFPTGIVDSTYVGPSLQLDTGGNVLTGLNLSVGF